MGEDGGKVDRNGTKVNDKCASRYDYDKRSKHEGPDMLY